MGSSEVWCCWPGLVQSWSMVCRWSGFGNMYTLHMYNKSSRFWVEWMCQEACSRTNISGLELLVSVSGVDLPGLDPVSLSKRWSAGSWIVWMFLPACSRPFRQLGNVVWVWWMSFGFWLVELVGSFVTVSSVRWGTVSQGWRMSSRSWASSMSNVIRVYMFLFPSSGRLLLARVGGSHLGPGWAVGFSPRVAVSLVGWSHVVARCGSTKSGCGRAPCGEILSCRLVLILSRGFYQIWRPILVGSSGWDRRSR